MSGQEVITWLVGECKFRKVPPTDSAMILILRELYDIQAAVRTSKHRGEERMEKEPELECERLAKCRGLNYTHMPYQVQLLIKDVWLAGAVPLREQLAQMRISWNSALKGEDEALQGWRKAQRELEEALKVVRGYQVQHNVICSVESHNKITECPCENCIAARALARSTGTKEGR